MSKITQFKPVKGFLLTKPQQNEQSSSFEIYDKETPQRAKVLVVGDSTYHTSGQVFESPCKPGDVIVHSAFGFEDIRSEGEHYRLIPFDKVLAVETTNE